MSRVRKIVIVLVAVLTFTASIVFADYTPTNLDTKLPPLEVSYDIEEPENAQLIYENKNFSYYFKDERDVLIIVDKRNGYTWKSGLDIAAAKEVKAALRKDEPLGFEPLEDKMNQTYTGIANSLISLEYYDDSNNIKRLASAGEGALSNLLSVEGETNHFVLDISYEDILIELRVHLYLTENGYDIKIYDQEIMGEDKNVLAAILLNPFLGASGGRYQLYDETTGEHGDVIDKPEVPGYVLVPDGSGSLIRFSDYKVSLKSYEADVYGVNLSKDTYNTILDIDSFKPFKEPLMPVYGIAHGDQQAAFVGYATEGDEYMEVIVVPEENTTLYTWAYPRFVYNNLYYQVFNKRGEGYFSLFEQPNSFDIEFSYEFLAGNGETGYQADYVGMALMYRDYLLKEGLLVEKTMAYEDIPMRIDFIMSDQKKSVIGYEDVVTTTVSDVEAIVEDINNINLSIGLYGWQDGGITTSKPWKTDFTKKIGSEQAFADLFTEYNKIGIDISFVTDYVNINEEQLNYTGNAAKHINGWYLERHLLGDVPFTDFAYAKPAKSASWLTSQVEDLAKVDIGSHSIEGLSEILMSEHGNDSMNAEEVITLYQETLSNLPEDIELNLKTPNQYLWAYTDRFLQAPVYPTQFLIETDTVPFLQLVLNGSMEVYGPYSNFSFSSQKDMLRMIDYNIYPSFVLTEEASYLLSTTNSLDMYSTEYAQYKDLITTVYEEVNGALKEVINASWVSRDVLAVGIIKNSYDNGVEILINYSEEVYDYKGTQVVPMSYEIMR